MKVGRQVKIIELIGKYDIETQEELCSRLLAEGYDVTQATVSRDIRALKLVKSETRDGRMVYKSMEQTKDLSAKYVRILQDGFVSLDMAQNFLVMRTTSGMAMAVAAAIDSFKYPEVVGCIAGDDTIMIATREADDCLHVMQEIRKLLESTYADRT